MKYQELLKRIKSEMIDPIYLFTGEELYIGSIIENRIIESCVMAGLEGINVNLFNDKEDSLDDILNKCEVPPLASNKRIIILKEEVGLFNTLDEIFMKKLEKYLADPMPSTVLIIYEEKPDRRKKIYKNLVKYSCHVEFLKLNKIELETWIINRFRRVNKSIPKATLSRYIMHTRYLENENVNLEMIDNDLNLLIDYSGNKSTITNTDVDMIAPPISEDNIFKMIDYSFEGKKDIALSMMKEFYLYGESPLGIFALILRQIRNILLVQLYMKQGQVLKDIARILKLPEFVIRKNMQNGKKYTTKQLIYQMVEMGKIDYRIKVGEIEPQMGIELLILQLQ